MRPHPAAFSMSQLLNKPSPSRPGQSTGPRLSSASLEAPASEPNRDAPPRSGSKDSSASKRLKVVSDEERVPFPENEAGSGQTLAQQRESYVGITIDNRYQVESVLGEGGMGVVYQCRHTIIGKRVALKLLRADLARDPEVTERFLNEARAASSIGNAHIIDISDFGHFEDGSTYLVMELLSGKTLSALLEAQQPLALPQLLHIALQLADGLSAAHEANIVHRDLKPENVFLITRGGEKDFVKILDFGIAKVSTASTGRLTRAGTVFGTPHYMSPEQASGAPVDHRGDIYALGVILHEMATGRVPFDAEDFMGILSQHMYKPPVPMRNFAPTAEIPAGLEAIVLKCMSKRPEMRYQTMQELAADLALLEHGAEPAALEEVSGRNEAFSVPPEYFTRADRKSSAPTLPQLSTGSRWNKAWILWPAAAAALGLGLGVVLNREAPAPKTVAVAAPARVAASAPAAATPPSTRQVMLAVEPLGAHVFRNGEDLGASPMMLSVTHGQTESVELRHPGYASQTVRLDGSEGRKEVRLDRASSRAESRARREAPVARPPARPGASEVINPWAK